LYYTNYAKPILHLNSILNETPILHLHCCGNGSACQKSVNNPQDQQQQQQPPAQRSVSDTLMIFSQQETNGKTNILSQSFVTGQVTTLVTNATSPYATDLRLVFVKSATTIGHGRLDGVAKTLPQLTRPSDPS
jgi:hypothetical protein